MSALARVLTRVCNDAAQLGLAAAHVVEDAVLTAERNEDDHARRSYVRAVCRCRVTSAAAAVITFGQNREEGMNNGQKKDH